MGAQGTLRQREEMDDQLLHGIAAARAGRRSEARAILTQVVERDERNEQAWLWLSGVVDSPEDVRICLENVLELNPEHTRARQGLEWLRARYGESGAGGQEAGGRRQESGREREVAGATAVDARLRQRLDAAAAVSPSAPPAPAPAVAAGRGASVAAPPARARGGAPEAAPAPAAPPADAENPCPYCGAPTTVRQRSCTQCRNSLMVQTPPPATPSRWLGLLASVWSACGALVIALGLVFAAATVLAYQEARFPAAGEARADAPLPFGLLTIAAALLVAGGALLSIVAPLRRRALPAFYAVVVLVPALLVAAAFVLSRELLGSALAGAGASADLLGGVAGGLLVGLAALMAGAALLGALAYGDFFGPMVRFTPVVEAAEPVTHYNNGVAYKNRGMWYMATREWERAVSAVPRDINYLRALGLAYAQIRRFDQAREKLDRALALAPGHAQIAEDRALVEQMAARAK